MQFLKKKYIIHQLKLAKAENFLVLIFAEVNIVKFGISVLLLICLHLFINK